MHKHRRYVSSLNDEIYLSSSKCRLCLKDEQFQIPIFGEVAQDMQIPLKIRTCLPVQISQDDIFPKNICYKCVVALEQNYNLWRTSSESDAVLKNLRNRANENGQSCEAISSLTMCDGPARPKNRRLFLPMGTSVVVESDSEEEWRGRSVLGKRLQDMPLLMDDSPDLLQSLEAEDTRDGPDVVVTGEKNLTSGSHLLETSANAWRQFYMRKQHAPEGRNATFGLPQRDEPLNFKSKEGNIALTSASSYQDPVRLSSALLDGISPDRNISTSDTVCENSTTSASAFWSQQGNTGPGIQTPSFFAPINGTTDYASKLQPSHSSILTSSSKMRSVNYESPPTRTASSMFERKPSGFWNSSYDATCRSSSMKNYANVNTCMKEPQQSCYSVKPAANKQDNSGFSLTDLQSSSAAVRAQTNIMNIISGKCDELTQDAQPSCFLLPTNDKSNTTKTNECDETSSKSESQLSSSSLKNRILSSKTQEELLEIIGDSSRFVSRASDTMPSALLQRLQAMQPWEHQQHATSFQ